VVVVGTELTGNVPVERMWERACSRSGKEIASGQSQSTRPSLMGSLVLGCESAGEIQGRRGKTNSDSAL
jgi:hypothetical protein